MSKKEISSGAEKAEKLAKTGNNGAKTQQIKSESANKKTATSAKKETNAKQTKKQSAKRAPAKKEKRTDKIKEREEKKLALAKIRAEKKQQRLEKKLAHKQQRLDRLAALKEKRAERKEKRAERKAMLRSETKEARADRRKEERLAKLEAKAAKREARLADKRAQREHRLKVRAEKRANRREKQHAPGFGGWLAAVISLGVTTLVLGTMFTFGWINMNGMQADMAGGQTQSLYELNSLVDNLDNNLAKARVATANGERAKVLTDIIIDSETAEVVLERMPMESALTGKITAFINGMSESAQQMLLKVASGKTLTENDDATIEYMYKTNLQLKQTLNELTSTCCEKDMIAALRGKADNLMFSTFGDIENGLIGEPENITEGPFARNTEKVSAKNLENMKEITAPEAEELAKKYFADYGVENATCTGEAVAKGLTLYNVNLKVKDGEMMAQLSKQGGKVVMFDSFKECDDKNFSVERCIDIAQDFLTNIGYEGMKAVWTSENSTTCSLNFAYVTDDVVIYPDVVKVKVCEQRGIVTGIEAISYVLNHTERSLPEAQISAEEAQNNVSTSLTVSGSRLTLIPLNGEEVLAWEIVGKIGESEYFVYVDAATGEEVQIFTVVGTKQGRALM